MKKNLQIPPKSLTFRNLFRFFWREGVGLPVGRDGLGQRWNYQSFDAAMREYGNGIGDSAMEGWQSGSQTPRHNNMEALARVAGDGKPKFVGSWPRELSLAIIRQETASELLEQRVHAVVTQPSVLPDPYVSDLKICGEDCFSQGTKTSTSTITRFPRGTRTIYVSFQLNNMPTGKMFQRRWYRNGEKFKGLTDFYDGAWPGYTFLYNRWGHEPGEYAVRVIVDDVLRRRGLWWGDKQAYCRAIQTRNYFLKVSKKSGSIHPFAF
jgi:hypothetical protein